MRAKCPKCGSKNILLMPREYWEGDHYRGGKRRKPRLMRCGDCTHTARKSKFLKEKYETQFYLIQGEVK